MTTQSDRWLLPEGVEELLPAQAEALEIARRRLLDLFHSWGYELVDPPLIEYRESLLVGTGGDLDLQTFKLIDQLTGRLLAVRADITPQIARIDAHRLQRNSPARLCYMGAVLRTHPYGSLRTRSPFQVGVELCGHAGIQSDVEVLHLMVESLAVIGLGKVHIDLGHVGIFRALARDAQLAEHEELVLFDALQRKASSEIKELLNHLDLNGRQRDQLAALIELNGDESVLDEARGRFQGGSHQLTAALDGLQRITDEIRQRIPEVPLYFDLAELRGYQYQTGIVFAAFVPGHGEEIARGGRYEDLGKAFGRTRPATGFSTDLKTLMMLADNSPGLPRSIIRAPWCNEAALHDLVRSLRSRGETVVFELPGQLADGSSSGEDRVIELVQGEWQVTTNKKSNSGNA